MIWDHLKISAAIKSTNPTWYASLLDLFNVFPAQGKTCALTPDGIIANASAYSGVQSRTRMTITAPFSLACFCRLKDPTSTGVLFTHQASWPASGFDIYCGSSNIGFRTYNGSTNNNASLQHTGYRFGTFFVVLTLDSALKASLYVNCAGKSATVSYVPSSAINLFIGSGFSLSRTGNILIAHATLWSRVLTPSEIWSIDSASKLHMPARKTAFNARTPINLLAGRAA